jgi:hypothetical protein
MVLEYVNVNVNIHVTVLLEHTFYYFIIDTITEAYTVMEGVFSSETQSFILTPLILK